MISSSIAVQQLLCPNATDGTANESHPSRIRENVFNQEGQAFQSRVSLETAAALASMAAASMSHQLASDT